MSIKAFVLAGIMAANSMMPVNTLKVESKYINMGQFEVTAYCGCDSCNGAENHDKYGRPINHKDEVLKVEYVAADESVLPYGTVIEVDGKEYVVKDVGGGVKGKHIDIYMEKHSDTERYGRKWKEVKVVK